MKVAIYTAIFGNYDQLIPQPKMPNVDYICYTDHTLSAKNWQIRKVKPPVPNDPARSNRYYKINPHVHLPDYDYSLYIDGNMLIIHDLEKLMYTVFQKTNMAVFSHTPPIENPQNCIYREYQRIVEHGEKTGKWMDDPQVMQKHIEFLRAENYPEEVGLLVGSVLFRKHHHEQVVETMNQWWHMVQNYSRRDQLSFNYAVWKTGLNVMYLPGEVRFNNPWFWRLGGHKQALWFRLLKYKFRKFIGIIKHPQEQPFLNLLAT